MVDATAWTISNSYINKLLNISVSGCSINLELCIRTLHICAEFK